MIRTILVISAILLAVYSEQIESSFVKKIQLDNVQFKNETSASSKQRLFGSIFKPIWGIIKPPPVIINKPVATTSTLSPDCGITKESVVNDPNNGLCKAKSTLDCCGTYFVQSCSYSCDIFPNIIGFASGKNLDQKKCAEDSFKDFLSNLNDDLQKAKNYKSYNEFYMKNSCTEYICNFSAKVGFCKAIKISYFYNKKTAKCERFVNFNSCRGKENFDTLEECNKTCVKNYLS